MPVKEGRPRPSQYFCVGTDALVRPAGEARVQLSPRSCRCQFTSDKHYLRFFAEFFLVLLEVGTCLLLTADG